MSDDEINITYETLFEILRLEKNRADLQKLDSKFYDNVATYILDKTKMFKSEMDSPGNEVELKAKQLSNIKKIVRDIYFRRIKKILNTALTQNLTQNNISNSDLMLDVENEFYNEISKVMSNHKEEVLHSVINSQVNSQVQSNLEDTPETSKNDDKPEKATKRTNGLKNDGSNDDNSLDSMEGNKNAKDSKDGLDTGIDKKDNKDSLSSDDPISDMENLMVRFTKDVPKFIGEDFEEYGPFLEDDVANIPKQLANILINKGNAVEIKS
jgi:DNA replication initiation complex subunit (GINS family)